MTTTDIAVRQQATAVPAKLQYAKALADSGLLPAAYRKQPANVLYAVEYGEMLGLSTMAAITGVHVIEGKPTASAGLISALVRRAGHKLRVRGDGKSATCQIVRSDDPGFTFEVTFTVEDAKTAGLLNKDVWKKYGPSMLKARAITQCARDACEEALFGLHYTAEELGADVDEDGVVIGQIADEQPAARPAENVPPPDDRAWVDQAIADAAALKSEHAASKLWQETVDKANAGEITAQDYEQLKDLIGGQVEHLRQSAFERAVSVLSEDEPWRAKLDELTSGDDADRALAELDGMKDQQRAGRIRHAVTTLAVLKRWNLSDAEAAA